MMSICLTLLAVLLLVGAATDIASRRIPNWLTAAVPGLYVLYIIVAPFPVHWVTGMTVASASFMVGFLLFTLNLMGGGDVKLISGLALWAGLDNIALLMLAIGLAGGGLALVVLLIKRIENHPLTIAFWPFLSTWLSSRLGIAAPAPQLVGKTCRGSDHQDAESLPYGVAIAIGGLVLVSVLSKL